METYESINTKDVHIVFANISFIILCLRGYFAGIVDDTLIVTLFLNLCIILSIDFTKARTSFFSFAILSFLTIYNKDVLALIDLLAIIYILKGTPIQKLIKINFMILIIYILIWIILLKINILNDRLVTMPKGTAHCLGYNNPNQLGMLGFQIIASLFLILKNKGRLILFFAIPIINEYFFSYSISRTPWIGGYVMMFIMLLSALKLIRPWMRYFVAVLPIILFITLIYLAKHLVQYPELDIIFTTRFSNYANLLNRLSLLNWIIGIPQSKEIIVDSSYFMILCSGGIGCLIIFWGAYIKAMIVKWKYMIYYLPFIIAMLANGIGENAFSSASGLSLIFWYIIFNPLVKSKITNKTMICFS